MFLSSAMKLWQGNDFTSLCQEFCPQGNGGYAWGRGLHGEGGCGKGHAWLGHAWQGTCMAGGHAWCGVVWLRGAWQGCMTGSMHDRGTHVLGACVVWCVHGMHAPHWIL